MYHLTFTSHAMSVYGNVSLLSWSVGPPLWLRLNILTTIWWFAMEFYTVINGSQRMNPNNSNDPDIFLSFHHVKFWIFPKLWFLTKCRIPIILNCTLCLVPITTVNICMLACLTKIVTMVNIIPAWHQHVSIVIARMLAWSIPNMSHCTMRAVA